MSSIQPADFSKAFAHTDEDARSNKPVQVRLSSGITLFLSYLNYLKYVDRYVITNKSKILSGKVKVRDIEIAFRGAVESELKVYASEKVAPVKFLLDLYGRENYDYLTRGCQSQYVQYTYERISDTRCAPEVPLHYQKIQKEFPLFDIESSVQPFHPTLVGSQIKSREEYFQDWVSDKLKEEKCKLAELSIEKTASVSGGVKAGTPSLSFGAFPSAYYSWKVKDVAPLLNEVNRRAPQMVFKKLNEVDVHEVELGLKRTVNAGSPQQAWDVIYGNLSRPEHAPKKTRGGRPGPVAPSKVDRTFPRQPGCPAPEKVRVRRVGADRLEPHQQEERRGTKLCFRAKQGGGRGGL